MEQNCPRGSWTPAVHGLCVRVFFFYISVHVSKNICMCHIGFVFVTFDVIYWVYRYPAATIATAILQQQQKHALIFPQWTCKARPWLYSFLMSTQCTSPRSDDLMWFTRTFPYFLKTQLFSTSGPGITYKLHGSSSSETHGDNGFPSEHFAVLSFFFLRWSMNPLLLCTIWEEPESESGRRRAERKWW